ncbi:MAG: hypothetical protein AB7N99_06340 [Simkaniaceae bacterium]
MARVKYSDKPFKIAAEALLPRLSLTLEKLGIKVSEDVLTKALRTHSTKELQLVAEKSAKDLALLQRTQQPVYRSGVGFPSNEITSIEGRFASRVSSVSIEREALREIATLKGSNRLDVIVRNSCNSRNLNESQIRSILRQNGFNPPPRPPGIPADSIVQVSSKSGGIIYVKPGTRAVESVHIRVMPANPASINPMQHRPYVIQRRGKEAVLKDGILVKPSETEAHIPLAEFEFKGW